MYMYYIKTYQTSIVIISGYKPLVIFCTTNLEQQTCITFKDQEKINATWRKGNRNLIFLTNGALNSL